MLTFYNVMHGVFFIHRWILHFTIYPWFFDVLQNFVKMGKYLNFFFGGGCQSLFEFQKVSHSINVWHLIF